ncbi:hypothetical protein ABZP36_001853 [Zizania latifolia]
MAVVAGLVADPLKVRIRLKPVGVASGGDDSASVAERRRVDRGEGMPMEPLPTSGTKRRLDGDEESRAIKGRECYEASRSIRRRDGAAPRASTRCEDDEASRPCKKKKASEPAAHVPSTRPMRPAARQCMKDDYSRASRRREDNEASRASKKKPASEKAAHLPSTRTTRPAARASCKNKKEENLRVRHNAPLRPINKYKTGDRREEKHLESTQERPRICTPRVPPPAPAARLDAFSAQDALSAAIAKAHSVLHMPRGLWLQREEARRQLDKIVRTVEFNDPYISPQGVFKP